MKKYFLLIFLFLAAMLISSCTASNNTAMPTKEIDSAYLSDGGGDPRTRAYWALWNSCAEENRADVAEANGGREAGWYLMDDLLADPGIQLGDLPVDTCQQGLALLQPTVDEPEENAALVFTLAAQLLAAELNLNLGAETCPIAEEAVLGAHIYLADLGFDGTSVTADALSAERVEAISQLVDLLTVYNTGELCVE